MPPIPAKLLGPYRRLLSARDDLRAAFPELSFALDGNLVGHIGEAIAVSDFNLTKLPSGYKTHDFKASNGTHVQVKTTQQSKEGRGVSLGLVKTSFEHLVVLQLSEVGTYTILYDGPGSYIDSATATESSASLSVGQLRRLNDQVQSGHKLCST